MYSIERKSEIMNMLEAFGSVDVNGLAAKFDASKETIRRDLRELEQEGALMRTHGGAVPCDTSTTTSSSNVMEYPVAVREIQCYEEKNSICKIAASYIKDGDTVFVDNSSTCIYLPRYIPSDIRVTFVTNSVKFLLEATKDPLHNHTLICLGGYFNDRNLSLYGPSTIKNIEEYYPNKTFISCAGIHPHNMFADSSIQEIDVKRLMVKRAQEVFLLADYTKFHKASQIFLTDFSSVNYLITDRNTNPASLDYISRTSMKLLVAD